MFSNILLSVTCLVLASYLVVKLEESKLGKENLADEINKEKSEIE